MVHVFQYQQMPEALDVCVDTNHAGCLRTRKSTNGGMIKHGKNVVKTWSSTQAVVALSSGESEYYGIVKGASEALGIRSMLQDWGIRCAVKLWTDSSAAKGIANRVGLSKRTRHIAVHHLWVQERVENKELVVGKIAGEKNPADIGTKYVAQDLMDRHLKNMGMEV